MSSPQSFYWSQSFYWGPIKLGFPEIAVNVSIRPRHIGPIRNADYNTQ